MIVLALRFHFCRLCQTSTCRAAWFEPGAFSCELADFERETLGDREYRALATRAVGRDLS